jgi:hypothetical protein
VIAKGGHPVGKTGGPDGLALPGEHLPKTLVVANALALPPSGVGRALYGQPQSALLGQSRLVASLARSSWSTRSVGLAGRRSLMEGNPPLSVG